MRWLHRMACRTTRPWIDAPCRADPGHDRRQPGTCPNQVHATTAGWVTSELGRQPWTIYGILKTADALTPMPGLVVPFILITLVYCALAGVVVRLLYRQIVQ